MTSRHERAVQAARDHTAAWERILARFAGDAGVGLLYSLYRHAFASLPAAIVSTVLLRAVLDRLIDDTERLARSALDDAADSGAAAAEDQVALLPQMDRRIRVRPVPALLRDSAIGAVIGVLTAQRAQVLSLVATGRATAASIIGTDASPGILNPVPVALATTDQVVAIGQAPLTRALAPATPASAGRPVYYLQAIAGIDERTTECCLNIHGHAVPIGGLFHLTAMPRYADYLPGPPFHKWCRTATGLILMSELDDPLTRELFAAASEELRQRKLARAERLLFSPPTHARTKRTRAR